MKAEKPAAQMMTQHCACRVPSSFFAFLFFWTVSRQRLMASLCKNRLGCHGSPDIFFVKGLVTRCVKDGGRDVIILLLVFVLLRTLFFFLLFVHFPTVMWLAITSQKATTLKLPRNMCTLTSTLHQPSRFLLCLFWLFLLLLLWFLVASAPKSMQHSAANVSKYFILSMFSMFHHWNIQSAHWDLDALQQEHPTTWPMV